MITNNWIFISLLSILPPIHFSVKLHYNISLFNHPSPNSLITRGNPTKEDKLAITRDYLLQYYVEHYPRQPAQYQQIFAELVNLCNQFSFYLESFMDVDFSSLRQDSESDLQNLQKLLSDIRTFRVFSKGVLGDFMNTAKCSELKHTVMYSSEISVETMLVIILLMGTILYAITKFFL